MVSTLPISLEPSNSISTCRIIHSLRLHRRTTTLLFKVPTYILLPINPIPTILLLLNQPIPLLPPFKTISRVTESITKRTLHTNLIQLYSLTIDECLCIQARNLGKIFAAPCCLKIFDFAVSTSPFSSIFYDARSSLSRL